MGMTIKILSWIATGLVFPICLSAQNAGIDSLLIKIKGLQVLVKNANYNSGIFPSQRCYLTGKNIEREDDNIFFTGLIVWTLNSLKPRLSQNNQEIVDQISKQAITNYHLYQNKDGRVGFNFWQTRPSKHFPNSRYFSSRRKFIIPDDLDDSAILFLSTNFSDSLKQALKLLLAENANGQKSTIKNTFRKYKHYAAYSTWFGKNMPVDFDICVQANGLRFVLDNGFQLNRFDSATIDLIKDMVISGDYLKRPAFVSPHYQKPEIILYHLARLVAAHPAQKKLVEIKPQLLMDIQGQMKKTTNRLSLLLLQTSLLRLGYNCDKEFKPTENDLYNFYFFVANMTSVFPNPIKGLFVKSRVTNFFYRSEAYYFTLILENELYKMNQ